MSEEAQYQAAVIQAMAYASADCFRRNLPRLLAEAYLRGKRDALKAARWKPLPPQQEKMVRRENKWKDVRKFRTSIRRFPGKEQNWKPLGKFPNATGKHQTVAHIRRNESPFPSSTDTARGTRRRPFNAP